MSNPGKIARLPRDIRDELNRRLDDGQPGPQILSWLNGDGTVKEILGDEFDSKPVSKQNLSAWRNGGFQQWQNQRDSMEIAKKLSADLVKTASVCKKHSGAEEDDGFSDRISQWVCAHFAVMARALVDSTSRKEPGRMQAALGRLVRGATALRRGDHSAALLRLRRERLEFQQTKTRDAWERAFWKRLQSKEFLAELKARKQAGTLEPVNPGQARSSMVKDEKNNSAQNGAGDPAKEEAWIAASDNLSK